MKQKITINKENIIGKVERNVWGSFIEMMGRAVYGGIYQPNHPTSDKEGFRGDVIEAVKELNVPIIRYPGGNMLSGYDWRDGIGKNRPVRLELAWGEIEPNAMGIHEFCSWSDKVGSEVMMCINMGTGSPREAAELVEYCNHPSGTTLSDLRIKNGAKEPFKIKKWCIGNEMDGHWQICGLKADEYGRKAYETAKIMKYVDRDIELIVCGSADRASHPSWDRTTLEYTYDLVDYISVHSYFSYTQNGKMFDFLSCHSNLDEYLKGFVATADYVKALRRSKKKMMLSVDEWNIWHMKPSVVCKNTYDDQYVDRWTIGPRRVENIYDFADALAFSGLICTLINHADRVKMGCLAQLINVIAPIMTNDETVLKQTLYYPYLLANKYAKGDALNLRISCPIIETENGDSGEVCGACTKDGNEYCLWMINKTNAWQNYDVIFEVDDVALTERIEMCSELHSFNDFSHPDDVGLRKIPVNSKKAKTFSVRLPAYSLTLFRFTE